MSQSVSPYYSGNYNVQPCFDGPKSWVTLVDMEVPPNLDGSGQREMSPVEARTLGLALVAGAEKAEAMSDAWVQRQEAAQ